MMTDWKSAIEMSRDLLAAKYLCLLCLGAIVLDFSHSLRLDYQLLFNQEKRKESKKIRWPQVCYFACKLFYFPFWVVTFITGEASYRIDCQTTITMSEILMGIVTCLCSALLGFRTLCIWEQRSGKIVSVKPSRRLYASNSFLYQFKWTLFLLWLGLLAVWMAGVPDVKGRWTTGIGPLWVKDQGACLFDPFPFRYPVKFVATVGYDALILLLTIVGVMETRIKTRLGSVCE